MPSLFSPLALHSLRILIHRPATTAIKRTTTCFQPILRTPAAAQAFAAAKPSLIRQFSSSPFQQATYNQVRRGCRKAQAARRSRSPALINRSQMKGVCMKTGITKPKKPNSGERKTARVRLSSGKVVTAYIPGEGRSSKPSTPLSLLFDASSD
jgi:small subunit ribosomal protein S12